MSKNKYIEIFSGVGLGVLVGIVIGLSVSNVVGIVLGALTSLLATFFGLNSAKENLQNDLKYQTKPLIIIFFSITTVIFILIGIFLRTHNILSPTIEEQKSELIKMGIKEDDLGKTLLKIRYDIVLDSQGETVNNESTHNTTSTSLYGVQLNAANSIFTKPTYTNDEVAKIFISEQGAMTKFYNTIKYYVPDTIGQKDILTSTLKLLKGK